MSHNRCILLGTGTSQGIPIIGCKCAVCLSIDPKDKRLRTSALLQIDNSNIVIDVGPDFRQQMLVNKVNSLDAVLITHQHNDHIIGLDDVRPYNFMQRRAMPIYGSKEVLEDIHIKFNYAFAEDKYPGAPSFNTFEIDKTPFNINQIKIIPVEYLHGTMSVRGFRVKKFAYITDIKTITNAEKQKLYGLSNLVVSALNLAEHHSHFNLTEALEFIKELNPKHAYLTHLSHGMGMHKALLNQLPNNVKVGFDGLEIVID